MSNSGESLEAGRSRARTAVALGRALLFADFPYDHAITHTVWVRPPGPAPRLDPAIPGGDVVRQIAQQRQNIWTLDESGPGEVYGEEGRNGKGLYAKYSVVGLTSGGIVCRVVFELERRGVAGIPHDIDRTVVWPPEVPVPEHVGLQVYGPADLDDSFDLPFAQLAKRAELDPAIFE